MKNPEAVQINNCYGYISIVQFDENLTKIETVVVYGMCTCDCSEGIWDFPVVIQMGILNYNTAPIQCLCMYVDYGDLSVSHAIENNLHEQQCIIDLAKTSKYSALCKIYIYCIYVYKPS